VIALNREDAYCFKIRLMCGLREGYYEWLEGYLNSEAPLSEIVLNLSLCGSDINKAISCLHSFCMEQGFDESIVCEKLRLFLRDSYHTGCLSKDDAVAYMYRFANAHGVPGDFESAAWDSMYYMDDYYSLAKTGIIPWERFDCAFFSFLNDGTPIDTNRLMNHFGQE